jgi:hypothetical protein
MNLRIKSHISKIIRNESVVKITAKALAEVASFVVKELTICIRDHNRSKPKKLTVKKHYPAPQKTESQSATTDDAYDNWLDEPEPERPMCNPYGDSNGVCGHQQD